MPIQDVDVVAPAQAGEIVGNSALNAVLTGKAADSGKAAPAGLPQTTAAQPPSIAQLQRLINSMNKAIQQNNSNLEFSMDSESQRILVKLIDTSTGDVIRQIPSEEVLAIAESIKQMQHGLFLDKKA